MRVIETELPGVLIIEPRIFRDARGCFFETYQAARYAEAGIPAAFVQDNFSRSVRGTLRGLHFQEPQPQGKLVQVLRGRVFDVAVDVRPSSKTFKRWCAVELSDDDARQLWIPPGYAHGFYVLSEVADFHYKCTAPYRADADRSIRWDDPELGIAWPEGPRLLSPKDAAAPRLADAPVLPA